MSRLHPTLAHRVEGEEVLVFGPCFVTDEYHELRVPLEGFRAWNNGALIQNALPEVPIPEREFLISATSPAGWKEMFGSTQTTEG